MTVSRLDINITRLAGLGMIFGLLGLAPTFLLHTAKSCGTG